ncbi:MAG: hypothetical protein JW778_06380 [Candidatus Altiarchaeota archaeon]|nr:hypothetical protein [Candidatus Altiarchaeota archaeon]
MVVGQPDIFVGLIGVLFIILFAYFSSLIFFFPIAFVVVSILKRIFAGRKDFYPYIFAGIELVCGFFSYLGLGHIFLGRRRRGIMLLIGLFLFQTVVPVFYLYTHYDQLMYGVSKVVDVINPIRIIVAFLSAWWVYNTAKIKGPRSVYGLEKPKKGDEIPDLGIIRY